MRAKKNLKKSRDPAKQRMIMMNTKGVQNQIEFPKSHLIDSEFSVKPQYQKYKLEELFETLPNFDAPIMRFGFDQKSKDEGSDFQTINKVLGKAILNPNEKENQFFWTNVKKRNNSSIYEIGKKFPFQFQKMSV